MHFASGLLLLWPALTVATSSSSWADTSLTADTTSREYTFAIPASLSDIVTALRSAEASTSSSEPSSLYSESSTLSSDSSTTSTLSSSDSPTTSQLVEITTLTSDASTLSSESSTLSSESSTITPYTTLTDSTFTTTRNRTRTWTRITSSWPPNNTTIVDQTGCPLGSKKFGGQCSKYAFWPGGREAEQRCICAKEAADNSAVCVWDAPCPVGNCTISSDCGQHYACVKDSCCEKNVCALRCGFCQGTRLKIPERAKVTWIGRNRKHWW